MGVPESEWIALVEVLLATINQALDEVCDCLPDEEEQCGLCDQVDFAALGARSLLERAGMSVAE